VNGLILSYARPSGIFRTRIDIHSFQLALEGPMPSFYKEKNRYWFFYTPLSYELSPTASYFSIFLTYRKVKFQINIDIPPYIYGCKEINP
jgi:hypothetical protein